MFQKNKHNIKTTTGLLMVIAVFFCVLFGQGAHLHVLNIHIGDHLDVHAQVHAHESENPDDKPFQQDSDQDDHKHQVSTASDIIGTLTSPTQVKPDLKSCFVISLDAAVGAIHVELDDIPTLFDLPPPRPVSSQLQLFVFPLRGPPMV